MSGATTREDIKFQQRSKQSGVQQNSKWKNVTVAWCGPLQPSLVLFVFNYNAYNCFLLF